MDMTALKGLSIYTIDGEGPYVSIEFDFVTVLVQRTDEGVIADFMVPPAPDDAEGIEKIVHSTWLRADDVEPDDVEPDDVEPWSERRGLR